MTKKAHISSYVEDDLNEEIERLAEEADQSKSEFIAETLRNRVHQENIDEVNHETHAERRIEELVGQARDEVTGATDDLQNYLAVIGVHSIGTWELLKEEHGEVARQQALNKGAERLREDFEQLGIDIEPHQEISTDDTREQSGKPQSEAHARTSTANAGSGSGTDQAEENEEDDGGWSF